MSASMSIARLRPNSFTSLRTSLIRHARHAGDSHSEKLLHVVRVEHVRRGIVRRPSASSRDRVGAIQEAPHPVEHVEILAAAGLIHEVVQFGLLCVGQVDTGRP